MIHDVDNPLKSILLIKLSFAGERFKTPTNPADIVPLVAGGIGDARQWRPDLTTSQGWTWRKDTPKAPISAGALATNHVLRRPVELSYEAVVTDTPLIPFGTLGGLPGIRRADALWASLLGLYNSRAFVAVVAPVAVIETAQITGLTLNRTADDGSAYYISIEISEQRTYSLQLLSNIADVAAQDGAALTAASGVIIGGI
jgi:hypothetical protein